MSRYSQPLSVDEMHRAIDDAARATKAARDDHAKAVTALGAASSPAAEVRAKQLLERAAAKLKQRAAAEDALWTQYHAARDKRRGDSAQYKNPLLDNAYDRFRASSQQRGRRYKGYFIWSVILAVLVASITFAVVFGGEREGGLSEVPPESTVNMPNQLPDLAGASQDGQSDGAQAPFSTGTVDCAAPYSCVAEHVPSSLFAASSPPLGGTRWRPRGLAYKNDCTVTLPVRLHLPDAEKDESGILSNSHCSPTRGSLDGPADFHAGSEDLIARDLRERADAPVYVGDPHCASGQRCQYADAALLTTPNADWLVGRIARPSAPSNLPRIDLPLAVRNYGGRPHQDIASYWNVAGIARANHGDVVHKVGASSGWTTGIVVAPCHEFPFGGSSSDANIRMRCQIWWEAETLTNTEGDSGAPLFVCMDDPTCQDSDEAWLVGIHWGGEEEVPPIYCRSVRTGPCSFGVASPIGAVLEELGTDLPAGACVWITQERCYLLKEQP